MSSKQEPVAGYRAEDLAVAARSLRGVLAELDEPVSELTANLQVVGATFEVEPVHHKLRRDGYRK